MDVETAIYERRSVRSFKEEPLDKAHTDKILDAGRWAPSGLNNQPWRFMPLQGTKKDSLAKHTKYGKIILSAPAAIAVFLDPSASYNREKDLQAVGACIQNMLLMAKSLGIGSIWLGEIKNQSDDVKREFGIDMDLMAVLAIGYPQGKIPKSSRYELEKLIIDL